MVKFKRAPTADLKPATKRTYKSRLDLAKTYYKDKLGDRSVVSIDQPSVYQYAHFVKRSVPNPRTAELYLTTFAGFLNWTRRRFQLEFISITTEGFLSRNSERPAADERSSFSIDDIKALFINAQQYRHTSPYKFWVTIAMAFLGCRIEELAQLDLASDLKYDAASKIWYLFWLCSRSVLISSIINADKESGDEDRALQPNHESSRCAESRAT